MTHELEISIIKKRLLDIHGTISPEIKENTQIPKLPPIRSIIEFFSLRDIWTDVGGKSYVPRQVLSELIVRMDGEEKDQNQFSVFLSDKQEMLKKRLNVEPLSVSPKQKFQFYDTFYARALFSSIIDFDNGIYQSNDRHALRTILPVYEVVDDVDPEKLRSCYNNFFTAINKVRFYK